jgi:hypothetical protein
MPDNQATDQPTAEAMARLQDAHAKYLTAMQDTWATVFKNYNDTIAAYIKTQEDLLKSRACEPPPESK